MRRTTLTAAAFLIATFLISTLVAPLPAGATPSITVTPSTGLTAGQMVNVSGSGFNPNASLVSAECKAGPVSTSDCGTGNSVFAVADGTGAYAFDSSVRSFLNTANGPVDCTTAAGVCVIAVADSTDLSGTAVTAPLSFATPAPPQGGVLQAPAAPVAADVGGDITATNFAPFAVIEIDLCAAGAADATDCGVPQAVSVDGSGALTFLMVPSDTLLTQNGQSIDCTVDAACVYAAWDFRTFATLTTTPVRIAPEIAGSLTVAPSSNLYDGDVVTLSGSGWPADVYLQFAECDGTGNTAACGNFVNVATDANGAFSTPYTARVVPDPTQNLDCQTGPCWIVADWYASNSIVSAAQPVVFDSTPTPVTSRYTPGELALVAGAATTLGVSNAEFQHLGSWALAWVLGITGTGVIHSAPDAGLATVTTDWIPAEYGAMDSLAVAHGTTFAKFEKTGALVLAYLLAISPSSRR
jgi:hypothetical protein